MYPIDLLRLIWRNLGRMRARVAMTSTGVLIGTAAVVILISLGAGLQHSLTGELSSLADLTRITVISEGFAGRGGPSAPVRRQEQKVLNDDALRFIRQLPHVAAATPWQWVMGGELRLNRVVASPAILGIDPNHAAALGLEAERGAIRLGRGQAVVGAKVGESFYDPIREQPAEPMDLMGQLFQVQFSRMSTSGQLDTRNVRIRVSGVLAEGGQSDYNVYVRLDEALSMNEWITGERANIRRDGYPQVIVRADDPDQVVSIEQAITDAGFLAYSQRDMLRQVNTVFLILQAVLGGIGGIALVVAGLGIANTMIMAIYERTGEIGLMKAVGARNRDVMSVFLGEASAIGFLGGVLGMATGVAISRLINVVALAYLRTQAGEGLPETLVHTPLWLMLFAVGFATLAGTISGVYPAMRAATLSPVSALKYE